MNETSPPQSQLPPHVHVGIARDSVPAAVMGATWVPFGGTDIAVFTWASMTAIPVINPTNVPTTCAPPWCSPHTTNAETHGNPPKTNNATVNPGVFGDVSHWKRSACVASQLQP